MGRLCIVSRDFPTLPGYLMVVLDKELREPEGLDLIFDRRRVHRFPPGKIERRRSPGIEADLRAHGFVIVGPDGPHSRPDRSRGARPGRHRALRRGALLAFATAGVVAAVAAATHSLLTATPDERARLLARVASWARVAAPPTPVSERSASVSAPARVNAPRPGAPPAVTRGAAGRPLPPAPAEPDAGRAMAGAAHALPAAPARLEPSVSPPAATRPEPAGSSPAAAPAWKVSPGPSATTSSRQDPSASGAPAPGRTARTGGAPRVEIEAQPEGTEAERAIAYTVRLQDPGGRPVERAAVTLHGWMPNGTDVEVALEPTSTPGTYRGAVSVGPRTPTNLRVRIAHEGLRYEVPSGR